MITKNSVKKIKILVVNYESRPIKLNPADIIYEHTKNQLNLYIHS